VHLAGSVTVVGMIFSQLKRRVLNDMYTTQAMMQQRQSNREHGNAQATQ